MSALIFRNYLACKLLGEHIMQSLDTIYKKMASSLENGNGSDIFHQPAHPFDPERHIAPHVAHELNNILTIVQGYADRLLIKHGEDQSLLPQLRLISEAAKRAAAVVREATPSRKNGHSHHHPEQHNLQPVS
jgi:hypothetical protein